MTSKSEDAQVLLPTEEESSSLLMPRFTSTPLVVVATSPSTSSPSAIENTNTIEKELASASARARAPLQTFFADLAAKWCELEGIVARATEIDAAGDCAIEEVGSPLAEIADSIHFHQSMRGEFETTRGLAEKVVCDILAEELEGVCSLQKHTENVFSVYEEHRDKSVEMCACFVHDVTTTKLYGDKLAILITDDHARADVDFILATGIRAHEVVLDFIHENFEGTDEETGASAAETQRLLKCRSDLVRNKFETHGDSVEKISAFAMHMVDAEAYRVSAFNRTKLHMLTEYADAYGDEVAKVNEAIAAAVEDAYTLSRASEAVTVAVKALHDIIDKECETMIYAYMYAKLLEKGVGKGDGGASAGDGDGDAGDADEDADDDASASASDEKKVSKVKRARGC